MTRLPEYVPPRKGKAKVPKDIDGSKSSLQTSLLPGDIVFEGLHLERVPALKFEDWDLTNHKKFLDLATTKLMRQRKNLMAGTIELELRTWLRRVEKAGLLNILCVPHYHCAPVTVFVIR